MQTVFIRFAVPGAVFTAALYLSAVASGQTTVNVSDHRPLAAAADRLEQSSGIPINYEDVPYQNSADLEDVSSPAERKESPAYHLWVPRAGNLAVVLDSFTDTQSAMNAVLNAYRNGNLPGDFTVQQENGMFYFVAAKVLAANGTMNAVTSPMRATVTITYGQRTVFDTVQTLLDAVYKQSGVRIQIGSLPFLPQESITVRCNGQDRSHDSGRDTFSVRQSTVGLSFTVRLYGRVYAECAAAFVSDPTDYAACRSKDNNPSNTTHRTRTVVRPIQMT